MRGNVNNSELTMMMFIVRSHYFEARIWNAFFRLPINQPEPATDESQGVYSSISSTGSWSSGSTERGAKAVNGDSLEVN